MQFLKILFWCLLAFAAALFTYGNWSSIPIRLWSGMEALVRLPFLLLVLFLIGFVPTHLYHHAVRWRLRQRLVTCERELVDLRARPLPSPVLVAAPVDRAPSAGDAAAVEGQLL